LLLRAGDWSGERYFVLPLAGLFLGYIYWIFSTPWSGNGTKITKIGLLGLTVFAISADFHLPNQANLGYNWPVQVARIKEAEVQTEQAATKVIIPINPYPWEIEMEIVSPFFPNKPPRLRLPSILNEDIAVVENIMMSNDGEVQLPVPAPPDSAAGPIIKNQTLTQTFLATKNGLTGISLLLATYDRQNSGSVNFHLQRAEQVGTTNYIETISADAATIVNNGWLTLTFPPLDSENQRYAIVIVSDSSDPENAITAWMRTGDPYDDGQLMRTGKVLGGDLVFGVLYLNQ
jgi:hypothetical protein